MPTTLISNRFPFARSFDVRRIDEAHEQAPGVEPVFPEKDQALNYAQNRASFRSGEIRILNLIGKIERTIQFTEIDRKL